MYKKKVGIGLCNIYVFSRVPKEACLSMVFTVF